MDLTNKCKLVFDIVLKVTFRFKTLNLFYLVQRQSGLKFSISLPHHWALQFFYSFLSDAMATSEVRTYNNTFNSYFLKICESSCGVAILLHYNWVITYPWTSFQGILEISFPMESFSIHFNCPAVLLPLVLKSHLHDFFLIIIFIDQKREIIRLLIYIFILYLLLQPVASLFCWF